MIGITKNISKINLKKKYCANRFYPRTDTTLGKGQSLFKDTPLIRNLEMFVMNTTLYQLSLRKDDLKIIKKQHNFTIFCNNQRVLYRLNRKENPGNKTCSGII